MSYTLYYFPIRGRGEQIRVLLHALDVPFRDELVNGEEFGELRSKRPSPLAFNALPMLEDGDFRLVQGAAIMGYIGREHGASPSAPQQVAQAESITLGAEDFRMQYFKLFGDGAAAKQAEFLAGAFVNRWLPAFEQLLESNSSTHHFVGNALAYADAAVWDVLDAFVTYVDGVSLKSSPRLNAFYDAFAARESVARYLASRPD